MLGHARHPDLQLRRRGRLRWAAVAASAKRHACQPLSMPGSACRSVLLLRRPAPWGVGARGVPQTGGAAGIRWSCLRRVRFTCAERGVSAVVAGTAPAVGWSAGRGAPLEAAGVFRRSSRWVDKMACKPGSLRFAAGGIRIGRGEVISGEKRCGRGSWCGLSARSRRFLGLISPPCPCHLSFLWCGSRPPSLTRVLFALVAGEECSGGCQLKAACGCCATACVRGWRWK